MFGTLSVCEAPEYTAQGHSYRVELRYLTRLTYSCGFMSLEIHEKLVFVFTVDLHQFPTEETAESKSAFPTFLGMTRKKRAVVVKIPAQPLRQDSGNGKKGVPKRYRTRCTGKNF